ncbi:MAG: GumC family protein [Janthinobacterium lividum]
MNVQELLRQLLRHWLLLLVVPLTTAGSIYFFSRSQQKKYESDTVLYTGITSGYKIEGGNNDGNSGWQATATAFDNLLSLINSRDTREEVALRLLAWRLQADASAAPATAATPVSGLLQALDARLPAKKKTPYDLLLTPALKAQLTDAKPAETTRRVQAAYQVGAGNPVFQLVNSKDPLFSETALLGINAARVKDSDLLRIDYAASDPVLCEKTLEILTQVFIRKHKELFTGQNESVLGYFTKSTQKAQDRLQAAEQKLLAFDEKHNIVDYDKQILTSTDEKQLAANKYAQLQMQYAGATSTLKSVEGSLSKRGESNLKSQEIIRLRGQVTEANSQIADLEIVNQAQHSASTTARLTSLRAEVAKLNATISETVDSYYSDSHSAQGVPVKDLVGEYSKNNLAVEDLKSQLSLMRQQSNLAASNYSQLVPLGVEIRKIRREVDVAEKDYLSQTEALKQSKLSQQNSVMASQLRVVDPPYLPSSASGSKLLLLLIGGFVGAFLLTGAGVAATGLLNVSLQNPAYATRVTTFPVVGIIPKITSPTAAQLGRAKRAEDHLARQLLLKFQQPRPAGRPYTIGVLSSQSGEGKTAVCHSLAASLRELNIHTVSLFPQDHSFQIIPDANTMLYSPLQALAPGVSVEDLTGPGLAADSVVIIEFPALLETAYPASLLQDLGLILVAVRAERNWVAADRTVFQNIQTVTKAPIELVLNGVLPEYVADFIGSRLRRTVAPVRRPALPVHPEQQLLNPYAEGDKLNYLNTQTRRVLSYFFPVPCSPHLPSPRAPRCPCFCWGWCWPWARAGSRPRMGWWCRGCW